MRVHEESEAISAKKKKKKPPSYSHCRLCQRDRLTRRREELGIYERCPPRAAARAQHGAGTRDAAILSLILSKITKELRWTAHSQGSVHYSQTKTTPRRGAAGLGSEDGSLCGTAPAEDACWSIRAAASPARCLQQGAGNTKITSWCSPSAEQHGTRIRLNERPQSTL